MSFRVKIVLPFLLLFLVFSSFMKLFWLPDLLQQEVSEEQENEQSFLQLLSTTLTPALLTGDLAEIHATLNRLMLDHKDEWGYLILEDARGAQLYPLTTVDIADPSRYLDLSQPIEFKGTPLGQLRVGQDLIHVNEEVGAHSTDLKLIFLLVLLVIIVPSVLALELWLIRPLRKLQTGANQMAKGDFQVHLPEATSKDELSGLVTAITTMRDKLRQRTDELQHERDFSNTILDAAGSVIVVLNRTGEIVLFNRAGEKLTGYRQAELQGKPVFTLLPLPAERQRAQNVFASLAAAHFPYEHESTWQTKNGQQLVLSWSQGCVVDNAGQVEFVIAVGADISERKKLEKEIKGVMATLEATNTKLQSYIQVVDQNVLTSTTDLDGRITSVSQAFCRVSGYPANEIIGQTHAMFRHPDVPEAFFKKMWQTIRTGQVWSGELKNRAKDGHDYWVQMVITPLFSPLGQLSGYTAVQHDISARKEIETLSTIDSLTGLYNRRHFHAVINDELGRIRRDGKMLGFIMFDVDHFKQYNDNYGHQQGDEALKMVGKTLMEYLRRPSDFGFRLGGEEFGIVISAHNVEEVFAFAERYRQCIEAQQLKHEQNSAAPYFTISMGVAVASGMNAEQEMLYKQADEALYRAKANGRNRVELANIPLTPP
ncbi:diguanylate cyclase [Shewanella sp. YIC-542]|uniref:diguanylate cyclase n=1 Tax=Shewanella mytili TaxID=3377111 RepID=UPI00398F816E